METLEAGNRTANKRGFTYVEAITAVAIIGILSALIAPNVVSFQRSQLDRQFPYSVADLVTRARNDAIASGMMTQLSYDSASNAFVLSEAKSATDTTLQEATRVTAPPDIQTGAFRTGTTQESGDQWKPSFYADGRGTQCGVELNAGLATTSVIIDANGNATVASGQLPDVTADSWQAGNLQVRNGG